MITQENIPYTADEIKAMVKTIEELRKKYNGALERAKMYHTGGSISDAHITEVIFPELNESEGEKIMKALIDYFDDANKSDENPLQSYGIQTDKVIDWLEKQGKNVQPDIPEDGQILNSLTDMDKRVLLDRPVTLRAVLAWLEKQNPAWSEEDMSKVQRICEYLVEAKKYYADITEVRECIDWLKSLEERMQPQPKQYEQAQFESAITWLEKQGEKFTAIDVDKMVMVYSHTKDGDFGMPVNCMIRAYRKGINDALKLSKERFTWKPSKEQIAALRWVLNNVPYNKHKEEINGLLDQIKDF